MFEPFRRKFSLTSNPEIGEECLPIYIHYFVFINSSFSPKKLSTSTYFLNTVTTIPTYFLKNNFYLATSVCIMYLQSTNSMKKQVYQKENILCCLKKKYASSFSSHFMYQNQITNILPSLDTTLLDRLQKLISVVLLAFSVKCYITIIKVNLYYMYLPSYLNLKVH